MELTNLQDPAEQIAAHRSRLYQVLTGAFAFPDEEFYEALRDGTFANALAEVCRGLPYDLTNLPTFDLGAEYDSYTDFEAEYVGLFDVGAAGPPCPLYGGAHAGDRMKVMEEATRFYNFFDLRISEQMHELPDHITTELEFLHYLTFREAEARQHGVDPTPLLRAERDFLERHLCKWVPRMQAKLTKQTAGTFYPALVQFAVTFFENDRAYAASAAGV